ncbi:MAG: hypothetical protein WD824_09170 [Cyclobacteriaceae bacterium]
MKSVEINKAELEKIQPNYGNVRRLLQKFGILVLITYPENG